MIKNRISTLPSSTDVLVEFPRWVTQYCDDTSIVLEVGAGKGKDGEAAPIQQRVARLVGIDPYPTIQENPYLDERYQVSVEDFAKDRGPSFDCLYTVAVLEHIRQPCEFLSACRSLLKPGGTLFSVTTNLWHYFGMATRLSSSLGIEDWLLDRLIGPEKKASYHFPTAYRLNNIRTIKRTLEQAGFQEVEFKFFDHPHSFEYVFPKQLRWFPSVYSRLVYTLRLPQIMGLIMFRATV